MRKPESVVEVFLKPGESYFGDRHTRIRTILGSCVAITLWHPRWLFGGMCHYMLPERARGASDFADGKYADEALHLLLMEIAKANTQVEDYEVKMFGGGDMFPLNVRQTAPNIGLKNVSAGRILIEEHGLNCKAEDLGGVGHRNVIFDVWSGHVWVRKNGESTAVRRPGRKKEAIV